MVERCSDIRDTCLVGEAVRRRADPSVTLAEALEQLLYQGVRPSAAPISRADASSKILDWHCESHRIRS